MDLAQQYIAKIKHHIQVLVELEEEYRGRFKSKIYLEKRRHNKNAAEHWKQKLLNLGRESTVLVAKFDLAVHHAGGVHIFKRYRTLYVGINDDIAKQLIILENPGACNFEIKTIQPGILKEI